MISEPNTEGYSFEQNLALRHRKICWENRESLFSDQVPLKVKKNMYRQFLNRSVVQENFIFLMKTILFLHQFIFILNFSKYRLYIKSFLKIPFLWTLQLSILHSILVLFFPKKNVFSFLIPPLFLAKKRCYFPCIQSCFSYYFQYSYLLEFLTLSEN